jgi:hypothetical protein
VGQGGAAVSSSQLKESNGSTTDLAHRYLDAAWNRMDLVALDELARTDLYVYYPLMPGATTDRDLLLEHGVTVTSR